MFSSQFAVYLISVYVIQGVQIPAATDLSVKTGCDTSTA